MREISHCQLMGRILQTDDRAYDPAGHAESREEDQAGSKAGDAQRRVSRLRQWGECLVRVHLDHHAPVKSGQVPPDGPHGVPEVIHRGTLSVNALDSDCERLARLIWQVVFPLEGCLGIMPGRGQENRVITDSSSQDDLPGLTETRSVAGKGRDPVDIELRGQNTDDGPSFLQRCRNESSHLLTRRVESKIRDLRRGDVFEAFSKCLSQR